MSWFSREVSDRAFCCYTATWVARASKRLGQCKQLRRQLFRNATIKVVESSGLVPSGRPSCHGSRHFPERPFPASYKDYSRAAGSIRALYEWATIRPELALALRWFGEKNRP